MKRILTFFIFILLAMGPGAAGAQTVVMDEGHVAFDYPDSWLVVSPQLCGVYAPLLEDAGLDADELAQELEQQLNIITVQTGRRFVEDVDIAAFCQFTGQFQALHLAARKRAEGLSQGHIAQTDSLQQLQRLADLPLSKKGKCLCYCQRQNLFDRLVLIGIAQRRGIIPPSAALLAGDCHRICECHIRHDLTLALAHRAAAL